jgi:hypothetical protein
VITVAIVVGGLVLAFNAGVVGLTLWYERLDSKRRSRERCNVAENAPGSSSGVRFPPSPATSAARRD